MSFKYWQEKGHNVGLTDGQTSVGCWARAVETHMEDIKHRTKVPPKIHSWNQSTDSLGENTHQQCISSDQQVLCVHMYVRTPGTAEAVLFNSSQLKKLAGGWVIIPSLVACLVPAAENIFRGGNSRKDEALLTRTPSREGAGSWEVCALFHHKTLSFEFWQLAWLWLLPGSSLLGCDCAAR